MKNNYISINPDLADSFGHYLHFDLKVKESLPEKQLTIIANKRSVNLLSKDYLFIIPAFNKTTYQNIPLVDYKSISSFKQNLLKALQKIITSKTDHYVCYMYMGSIWHALAIAEVTTRLINLNISFHVNIFHDRYTFLSTNFNQSIYYKEYRVISKLIQIHFPNIKLYADTKLTQTVLQKHLDTTIRYFPMFSVTDFKNTYNKSQNVTKLNMVYAGNIQADKGFDLIVKWLEIADFTKLNLSFRCRTYISYYKKQHKIWAETIGQNESIEIIEGTLSKDAYISLIEQADIILIPYRTSAFRARTSGIYVDAIEKQKVVIVASDTWMANYTQVFRNGVVFKDGSVNSLDNYLQHLVKEYNTYKNNTSIAKLEWQKTNGIKNFVNILKASNETVENKDISIFHSSIRSIEQRKGHRLSRVMQKIRKARITAIAKSFFKI